MSACILDTIDFSPADEPQPSEDLRSDLLNWPHYQRHEFMRKLRDLTPTGLAEWSVTPVELSVLGLVRHLRQMEHSYLAWGMGGGEHTDFYGDEDYAGGSPGTVEDDCVAISPRSNARMRHLPGTRNRIDRSRTWPTAWVHPVEDA